MQGQAGLLLLALDGHLLDVRLLGRHPNGLCIERVGHVTQHEGTHVLSWQQLDLVQLRAPPQWHPLRQPDGTPCVCSKTA